MKENEKIHLNETGLCVTQKCSLKCKLCCAFSPYYNPAIEFSVERLKQTIDRYFSIVDTVNKFILSGGEPFCHSGLEKIIEYVVPYFSRITILEIITNGTLVPRNEVIQAIIKNRDKINIMIDDYGEVSKKVQVLKGLFDENKIQYRIRDYHSESLHCGGWVDFGDFTLLHKTKEEVEEKFLKCAYPQKLHFCFSTVNGEMHPCMPSKRCMELGIIPKQENEYIDLFDDSKSIDEQKSKIRGLFQMKSLSAVNVNIKRFKKWKIFMYSFLLNPPFVVLPKRLVFPLNGMTVPLLK